MGRGKRLEISLTSKDRQQLEQLLGGGLQSVRTVIRALALLQMDQGQSTPAVGANLMLSAKAVWQIGKRYQQGGIERALFDAARPGKTPALDQQQQQRIVAVVCSPPYTLGRLGILMLGWGDVVFWFGIFFIVVGAALQTGATSAVKAVKMSAKLVGAPSTVPTSSE